MGVGHKEILQGLGKKDGVKRENLPVTPGPLYKSGD